MTSSIVEIRTADKEELESWDGFVQQSQSGTIFHTLKWANLIREVSKVEFIPLVIDIKGKMRGIFPLYLQGSVLRRLMSPPFSTSTAYGGWVLQLGSATDCDAITHEILKYLRGVERAKMAFWSRIELPPFTIIPSSLKYGYAKKLGFTYIVDLKPNIEQIWRNMEERGRTAVRKARKEKVDIKETRDDAYLKRHIDMVGATYTAEGLTSPDPLIKERAWVVLGDDMKLFIAESGGEVIGSILVLICDKRIYYWSGVYNHEFRYKNPTNLLLWHTIEWAKGQGMEHFDLTGANVPRIAKFKRTFGGELVGYPIIERGNRLVSLGMNCYTKYVRRSRLLTSIIRKM